MDQRRLARISRSANSGFANGSVTRTLLCGDLFAQPGNTLPALTTSADAVWEMSESLRQGFPYAPVTNAKSLLDKLSAFEPKLLACMHGSSYEGDGAKLLRRLGDVLA